MNLLLSYRNDQTYREVYTDDFKNYYKNKDKPKLYNKSDIIEIFKELDINDISGCKINRIYDSIEDIYCAPNNDIVYIRSGPGNNYIPFSTTMFHKKFKIECIINDWIKLFNEDKYIRINSVKKYKPYSHFSKSPYKCTIHMQNDRTNIILYNYGFTPKESYLNCLDFINKFGHI